MDSPLNLSTQRVKASEETWCPVRDVNKQGLGLSFFLAGNCNVIGNGYTGLELFADHLPSFVPRTCLKALG